MANSARRPSGEPVTAPPAPDQSPDAAPDQRAELFEWCENQQARIVWGEYLNLKRFCRVRVGRQIECEGPDFVTACSDAKRRWERSQRMQPLRAEA